MRSISDDREMEVSFTSYYVSIHYRYIVFSISVTIYVLCIQTRILLGNNIDPRHDLNIFFSINVYIKFYYYI